MSKNKNNDECAVVLYTLEIESKWYNSSSYCPWLYFIKTLKEHVVLLSQLHYDSYNTGILGVTKLNMKLFSFSLVLFQTPIYTNINILPKVKSDSILGARKHLMYNLNLRFDTLNPSYVLFYSYLMHINNISWEGPLV